jgi:hypothetical protein
VDILAKAVSATLGPKGRTVIIGKTKFRGRIVLLIPVIRSGIWWTKDY